MTITVSQPEKINAIEGQKVEFKTSVFYREILLKHCGLEFSALKLVDGREHGP